MSKLPGIVGHPAGVTSRCHIKLLGVCVGVGGGAALGGGNLYTFGDQKCQKLFYVSSKGDSHRRNTQLGRSEVFPAQVEI